MNLWLCEHVDLKLVDDLHKDRKNILVHGNALAKFSGLCRNFPVSPMHWLDKRELLTYRDEKIAWDKRSRHDIKHSFAIHCAEESRFGINPVFAGALERLFYPCSYGCLDALIFALSSWKSWKQGNSPVRIILGENYRLTELVALVWWLAVCNRQFAAQNIEYIGVSRYTSAARVDSVHEALRLLSSNTLTEPRVDGFIPESIRTGKEPICLAWVGALRYPRGWDAEIHRRLGESMRILRVAEPNMSFHHDSPCIEVAAGNSGLQESLHWLLQCADDALSEAWEVMDADPVLRLNRMGNAIHTFFLNGVAPFALEHISRIVDRLDQELGSIDLKEFFSTTVPFIESIALHEWALKRNVLPVLLPHSYTSSHEFPAATYKASVTFIRSALIMPSAHDDPGSLAKEEVISLNQIRSHNSINSKHGKADGGKKYKNLRLLCLYPFGQMWRSVWKYGRQFVVSFYSRRLLKYRLKKTKLKIGFLLNYEHFEFTASLDFNDLFRFIADTARKLAELLPRGDAILVVRRKAGWTNLHLLGRYLRNVKLKSHANNVIFSPDRISLEDFGALCDVVLYFQGTSAAPELMSLGIPVVQVIDPNAPVMLDEPYIVFPEEIVPSMTIEEIMNRFQVDPQWLVGLSTLQQDWVSNQMMA